MRRALLVLLILFQGCPSRAPEETTETRTPLITARDRFFDVATRNGQKVVVVGFGGRILKSTDAGETWEHVPAPTDRSLLRMRFVDDTRGWIVGQDGVVLRTTDGGRTWTRQDSGTDRHLFGLWAFSRDHVVACGEKAVWIETRDGGETWVERTIPRSEIGVTDYVRLAIPDPVYYDVTFLDERRGWLVGEFGHILTTRDGGRTWQAQHETLIGQRLPDRRRPMRDALDFPAFFRVSVDVDGRGVVAGVGGVLMETEDFGEHWSLVGTGAVEAPLLDVSFDGREPLVTGGRGAALVRRNGVWQPVSLGLPVVTWIAGISFASEGELDDRTGFVVGGRGVILRTRDGGESWQPVGWSP